jgi:hypothetical protein
MSTDNEFIICDCCGDFFPDLEECEYCGKMLCEECGNEHAKSEGEEYEPDEFICWI